MPSASRRFWARCASSDVPNVATVTSCSGMVDSSSDGSVGDQFSDPKALPARNKPPESQRKVYLISDQLGRRAWTGNKKAPPPPWRRGLAPGAREGQFKEAAKRSRGDGRRTPRACSNAS